MSADPFAPAVAAGIRRLAIPTPFAVGRVNVYLIEDDPLTLVDAGPNSATSFDELRRGLAERGHALEDIGLIVLTHQHYDHLGLVSLVASMSGAEVAAIDVAVPLVENFSQEAQADDDFARDMMLRHGIPEDMAMALHSLSAAYRAWGARVDVTRPLRDGDALELRDRRLLVQPPSRPLPHRHRLPRPRPAHADRRRPPDRPHLLEPAHHQAARRLARSPSSPGALPAVARDHA